VHEIKKEIFKGDKKFLQAGIASIATRNRELRIIIAKTNFIILTIFSNLCM
jgi:hypothetical protein